MARKTRPQWALDPADVSTAWTGSASGGRARASQSRALDVRDSRLRLVHRPTGVEVAGEVPAGHYTRVKMRQLTAELHARLFAELARRVARHLRLPGQPPR